jgi:hypothetical protein
MAEANSLETTMGERTLVRPMALAFAAMLLCVTAMVVAMFLMLSPAGADAAVAEIVKSHAIGRAMAMLLIVPVIAILTAAGRISGDAGIAAISSVGGYILGSEAGAGAGP